MPTSSPRPALWISADLWGETVIALVLESEVVRAGVFAPAGAPLMLTDFVGRIVTYVEASREPDGTVHVFLGESGGAVDTLYRTLRELPGCTVVMLGTEAPALAALSDVVQRGKAKASLIHPYVEPAEPMPLFEPPVLSGVAEAQVPAEDPNNGLGGDGGYVPLAGFAQTTPEEAPPEERHGRHSAATVIGDVMAPGSILRGGSNRAPGGGRGAVDVLRADGPDRGPPPPVKQPRQSQDGVGAAPPGAPGQGAPAALPAPRAPVAHAPLAPSPWATPAAAALEQAVRVVAAAHPEEVLAATGQAPALADPGSLLLWSMTHGRVEDVLGASPDLAAEHLRALSTPHREAILAELGVATWGDVSVEEIALWLAERVGTGELPEASKRALAQYRVALRRR